MRKYVYWIIFSHSINGTVSGEFSIDKKITTSKQVIDITEYIKSSYRLKDVIIINWKFLRRDKQ